MNTNTTLPTIDGDATNVSVGWRQGDGTYRVCGFTLSEEEYNVAAVRGWMTELVQHTYLMGHEAGVESIDLQPTIARLHEELAEYRTAAENDGQTIEQLTEANRVQNERIQQLMQAEARLREQADDLTQSNIDLRRELADLRQDNLAQADALVERTNERDALAESIEAMRQGEATVPTVEPVHGERAVTVYRAESNFNVQPWGVMAEGQTADQLAAQLRGALADAFHAGRDSMAAEDRQLIESYRETANSDGVRIESLVGQLGRANAERDEALRKVDQMLADMDAINDGLNEQAQEHSLCRQYEESLDVINANTRILKLLGRVSDYTVTLEVEMDADYSTVDNRLKDVGFPESYDWSVGRQAEVTYYVTVNCTSDQIADKADEMRRQVYAMSNVTAVSVEWERDN
jgi:hypothetical protein